MAQQRRAVRASGSFRKLNGVLRYGRGDAGNDFNVTAMAYKASWNSSDQITQRAIDAGLIRSRFGTRLTQPTAAPRIATACPGAWRRSDVQSSTEANAYLIDNPARAVLQFHLRVPDNPVDGDQFAPTGPAPLPWSQPAPYPAAWHRVAEPEEHGWHAGAERQHLQRPAQHQSSADHWRDAAGSHRRSSLALYGENATRWAPWLRSVAGLRADAYRFKVNSDNACQ